MMSWMTSLDNSSEGFQSSAGLAVAVAEGVSSRPTPAVGDGGVSGRHGVVDDAPPAGGARHARPRPAADRLDARAARQHVDRNPRSRSSTWPTSSKSPCLATPAGVPYDVPSSRDGDRRPGGPRRAETSGLEPHGQRQEGGGPRRDGRGARPAARSRCRAGGRRQRTWFRPPAARSTASAWSASGGSPSASAETSRVGASSLGGALVTLRLPLALGHVPAVDDMRIVVCDDHRLLLEALAHALATRGFTVEAATSHPAEAVAAVKLYDPDLLLIDLSFPRATGSTQRGRSSPSIPARGSWSSPAPTTRRPRSRPPGSVWPGSSARTNDCPRSWRRSAGRRPASRGWTPAREAAALGPDTRAARAARWTT